MTCKKIIIPKIENLDSIVSTIPLSHHSITVQCRMKTYFHTFKINGHDDVFYNFPVLVNDDGSPWRDGIYFVLSIIKNHNSFKNYLSSANSRKVAHLIDFKNWCDRERVDMFDFGSRFPLQRPTYKYFVHLNQSNISAGNLNARTLTIYKFYEFCSTLHNIDMSRVDQVQQNFHQYISKHGLSYTKKVNTRELTLRKTRKVHHFTNMIIDEGEKLRPLTNHQKQKLLEALNSESISVDERLIFKMCLETGARKQTILTLRLEHIELFKRENLHSDLCYRIQAGHGTQIDTKKDKRLTIVIPEELAEELSIYAYSPAAQKLRKKFFKKFGKDLFEKDEQIYLFLAPQGDCRYMSKTDPRYDSTYSRPDGRSISNITKKLKSLLPKDFPSKYKFHWNRATFALSLYQKYLPLLNEKKITFEALIGIIQNALGHEDPITTLHYLKLFENDNTLMDMQEVWELAVSSRDEKKGPIL